MKYTYCFNQLRANEANADRIFLSYENAVKLCGHIDLHRYVTEDFGTVEAKTPLIACEKLYGKYNVGQKPEGFFGRSMSVSDIVELWNNETDPPEHTVWYCDSFSFKQIT